MGYPHYSTECAEHHDLVRDWHCAELDRPEIVCLCGSTRFREMFDTVAQTLTLAGKIVVGPAVWVRSDPSYADITAESKAALDELHRRKIDLADRVLVVNVGGYIGDSTRSEILYADTWRKPIDYLEPLGAEGRDRSRRTSDEHAARTR